MSTCAFANRAGEERASTPPAEERVTSFFARAKKKVTKKESTLRGAPGFTSCRQQWREESRFKGSGAKNALPSSNTAHAQQALPWKTLTRLDEHVIGICAAVTRAVCKT
jgi:hypothetical protein